MNEIGWMSLGRGVPRPRDTVRQAPGFTGPEALQILGDVDAAMCPFTGPADPAKQNWLSCSAGVSCGFWSGAAC